MTATKDRLASKTRRSDWFAAAGRAGLTARGVHYIAVGVLALHVAFGNEQRADRDGALQAVARQPLGRLLLVVLAAGMVGMVIWRLVRVVLDPGDKEDDASGLAKRAGEVGRGLLYVGGLATALPLIVGGNGDGNREEQDWTARASELPLGRWLVGVVGVGIVAAGLWNGWKAVSGRWRKRLDTSEMSKDEERWAEPVAVAGLIGRMLVFGLVGGFLVRAAVRYDPREGVGLDAALKEVGEKSYGPWGLSLFAVALMMFGLFSLLQARWRRVNE